MIELLPVTEEQFSVMVQHAIQGFAAECVEADRWSKATAYEHAKCLIEGDLPEGLDTPGHIFLT